MRRFFAERGLFDELEQMERIRKSRQGMMAKNRMFQEVLDGYAKRTAPQPAADAEAKDQHPVPLLDSGAADAVAVQAVEGRSSGDRVYSGGSIPEMARDDDTGPVIEE